jgi:hypothetical protein
MDGVLDSMFLVVLVSEVLDVLIVQVEEDPLPLDMVVMYQNKMF